MPLLFHDPQQTDYSKERGEFRCSCCADNPCRNPRSFAFGQSVGTVGYWHEWGSTDDPDQYLPEEVLVPRWKEAR